MPWRPLGPPKTVPRASPRSFPSPIFCGSYRFFDTFDRIIIHHSKTPAMAAGDPGSSSDLSGTRATGSGDSAQQGYGRERKSAEPGQTPPRDAKLAASTHTSFDPASTDWTHISIDKLVVSVLTERVAAAGSARAGAPAALNEGGLLTTSRASAAASINDGKSKNTSSSSTPSRVTLPSVVEPWLACRRTMRRLGFRSVSSAHGHIVEGDILLTEPTDNSSFWLARADVTAVVGPADRIRARWFRFDGTKFELDTTRPPIELEASSLLGFLKKCPEQEEIFMLCDFSARLKTGWLRDAYRSIGTVVKDAVTAGIGKWLDSTVDSSSNPKPSQNTSTNTGISRRVPGQTRTELAASAPPPLATAVPLPLPIVSHLGVQTQAADSTHTPDGTAANGSTLKRLLEALGDENGMDAGSSMGRMDAGAPLPMAKPPMTKPPGGSLGAKSGCSCSRSQCLKLYCDCFARQEYCWDCRCVDCYNYPGNEQRERALSAAIKEKKVFFKKKFKNAARSCNCRKSQCLKKYCECFTAGVPCDTRCRCIDCLNPHNKRKADEDTRDGMATSAGAVAKAAPTRQPRPAKRRRTSGGWAATVPVLSAANALSSAHLPSLLMAQSAAPAAVAVPVVPANLCTVRDSPFVHQTE